MARRHHPGVVLLICAFFLAGQACAEEPAPAEDRFQWGGAVEAGYRFTEIDGSRRYREAVNLDEGLKLFDFNLWMKDLERKGIADEARLRLGGIGDPYPSVRLDVKKHNVYQLSVDYREYDFFFNRQDFPPPFDFTNTLLTDNHDFDQKRRLGRILLTLFPADGVRVNLGYNFAQRTGEARVPRVLTFEPNFLQDLDEQFREFFALVDFQLKGWDVHVKQSFWTFDNTNSIDALPTLLEKRDESVWTYVNTIKAHTRLGEGWDFDGGYVYAHSEGDSRLRLRRAIPVQVAPGEGEFQFDTHIVEMGLSHLLREDWILHLDYRLHTFDQEGKTNTDLFFLPQRVVPTDYSLLAHTGTGQLEVTPLDNLTLRGGYRIQYREIEAENFAANIFDGGPRSQSDRIFSHGWVASGDWKPFKSLSLFGEYQGEAFDNPYTRISPEGEHIAKFRIRYDTPLKGLTLRGTTLWRRRTNPDQQYRLDVQDYIAAATYQPPAFQRLTLDFSYTYEKIRDKKDILNQEGIVPPPPPAIPTPLFSTFTFDSDAQIFSGGITCEGIYKGLGGSFTGSYARTREENSQRFAVASLRFWYKNPWLIPTVAFEKYELDDFERPADSFSANLVTISLRKEF